MIFCAAFGAFRDVLVHGRGFDVLSVFLLWGSALSAMAAEWALSTISCIGGYHLGHVSHVRYSVIYLYYVKKNPQPELSSICDTLYEGSVLARWLTSSIFFFLFGACAISLGISDTMISRCLSSVIGINASFKMNVGIILVISAVFTFILPCRPWPRAWLSSAA